MQDNDQEVITIAVIEKPQIILGTLTKNVRCLFEKRRLFVHIGKPDYKGVHLNEFDFRCEITSIKTPHIFLFKVRHREPIGEYPAFDVSLSTEGSGPMDHRLVNDLFRDLRTDPSEQELLYPSI